MKNTWQLQEAKNRLSTLVEGALHHGPQIITRRGVRTAIVLSVKDYERLTKPKQNKDKFLEIDKGEEDLRLFWQSFGSWKDERSPEQIIQEIYESRKSTSRDIQL